MNTINPQRIVLARESRALIQTDLAERLSMPHYKLSRMESGAFPFPAETVNAIALITNYPLSFFYQPEGPTADTLAFRKREKVAQKELTHLQARVNVLRLQVQYLTRTLKVPAPVLPLMQIAGAFTPDKAARKLRREWNISSGPIGDLTGIAEAHSIPVWRFDFETERIDSRSILTDDKYPLICINKRHPGDRQRFSLAYQLAHLLLHTYGPLGPGRDIGHEANLFAAELLMPEKEVRPFFDKGVTMGLLSDLKMKWKVSMISLLYRADDLGYLSENQKRYLVNQFNTQKLRKDEPVVSAVDPEVSKLLLQWISELKQRDRLDDAAMAARFHLHTNQYLESFGSAS